MKSRLPWSNKSITLLILEHWTRISKKINKDNCCCNETFHKWSWLSMYGFFEVVDWKDTIFTSNYKREIHEQIWRIKQRSLCGKPSELVGKNYGGDIHYMDVE